MKAAQETLEASGCPDPAVDARWIAEDCLGMNAAALRHGDLFKAVGKERFDLIASNPPYVRTSEMETLQTEVKYEPELALDGGLDGLDFYRRIAADAPKRLLPGGSLYLEVGEGEAADVLAMLREALSPAESGTLRDLNGIERVVWARTEQE